MRARGDRVRAGRRPPAAVGLALALLAVGLGACGGSHPRTAAGPSAAEPAAAPHALAEPAGRVLHVGSSPEGIVVDPDSRLAVVAVRNPAGLVLLDARHARVVRRIATAGAARHLQINARGTVLVPEESANTLLELALPSAHAHSIAVGAHPHDAAEVAGEVFVGDEFGRAVTVLDGSRIVRTIGGFPQPGGVTAVGSDAAVVDVRANTLTLIHGHSGAVLARLPAGSGPTHAVAEAGGRVYVIDTRGGAILAFQTQPRLRRVGRLPLAGAPYGVAIDSARHRLWVTLTAKNRLVELDTHGRVPRVLHEYPTAQQPNTVAVDERSGQVLVADAGSDSIQILTPRV